MKLKNAIFKLGRFCTMASVLACVGVLDQGRAWADTAPGTYTHCYVNLSGEASNESMIEWSNFLASIQNAAGHSLNGGIYTTQATGGELGF
jgi:hypothetical protein